MPEFLLELYSEEIPPQLQINARKEVKQSFEKQLEEEGIKSNFLLEYSSPTRLVMLIKNLPEKVKVSPKEIKGPKVGVPDSVLESFIKSQNVSKKQIFEKENEKGKFYFVKTVSKQIFVKDLLVKIIPKSLDAIRWRKSMKWSDNSLLWGRPLRSIFAIFNKKIL